MKLSEKTKVYLMGGLWIVLTLILLLLIGEVILPFVFAIFIAFLLNPIVIKIQAKIKNRNLAISTLLFGFTIVIVGVIFFFGSHIVKDTKRFITAVEVVGDENKQEINELKNNVLGFVDNVYESETVQNQIKSADTLSVESNKKTVMTTLERVYSFFDDSDKTKGKLENKSWNSFYMLLNTMLYSVFILYTYGYFEEKQKKYFGKLNQRGFKSFWLWHQFDVVFVNYFRQRAKVVMISMSIFIVTFSIIDLPGAILIGVIAGLLTYGAHFHYLSLPLVAIGCVVVSVERDTSFFLFFGIILVVYVLVSVIEEVVFFNKIMKSVSGMNPAIMLLSFTLWIYVFGGFLGTIVALPLTQLVMIILDRLLLTSVKEKIK